MFVGVAIFNRFLSRYSYRTIFIIAHIFTVFTALLDIVLVLRWNKMLGITDQVFILGDSIASPLVRRFISMPTCVLASRLCPAGGGGTSQVINFVHNIVILSYII